VSSDQTVCLIIPIGVNISQ